MKMRKKSEDSERMFFMMALTQSHPEMCNYFADNDPFGEQTRSSISYTRLHSSAWRFSAIVPVIFCAMLCAAP